MNAEPFNVDVEGSARVLKSLIDHSDCDTLACLLEHAFGCRVIDHPGNEGTSFTVIPIKGKYCGGLDCIRTEKTKNDAGQA